MDFFDQPDCFYYGGLGANWNMSQETQYEIGSRFFDLHVLSVCHKTTP